MCAYDPKSGSGPFCTTEALKRKAATKSLHKRQKLLFCSRIKCIHHIIIARIFVAWFPLFGCFALILKDGFGRGEGMSLEKQRCKGKKNLLFASASDLIKVYNPWIIGTINCNGSKRAIVLM